ncbi:cysteine desulfurase [Candidatus Kaiserbacteria bacterium]|nr:cysteine desulfurase [Candidatus Kaiserbacteria bacterium]
MNYHTKNIFGTRRIYLDHAAATPLDPRVLKKMQPYWNHHFGNAGGVYREGESAREALSLAREDIAHTLSVHPEEIIFTSGGTEANNLAILGFMEALSRKEELARTHIITNSGEHPSVRDSFLFLKEKGVSVSVVDFNEEGIVRPEDIRALLRRETRLVSISYVNNEIGTVQPIHEISEVLREHEKKEKVEVAFHTDASQAPLYFDCTPKYLGADMMTIDAQKIYGPKGVGFLYKRKNIELAPLMKGGNQEYGLRPGTENIPLIVGMKESFTEAAAHYMLESASIASLQDYFIEELKKHVPRAVLNGDRFKRSPSIINISIPGMDNEYLVIALDEHGIAAATKSACLGRQGEPSYVIELLSKSREVAKSAVRFSLGRKITRKDIDRVVSVLAHEVSKLDRFKL